jgi:hypothetical protein
MHLDGKFTDDEKANKKGNLTNHLVSFPLFRAEEFFFRGKLNKSQSLLSTQSTWILGRGCNQTIRLLI